MITTLARLDPEFSLRQEAKHTGEVMLTEIDYTAVDMTIGYLRALSFVITFDLAIKH